MIKAFIFDLDGTLVQTEALKAKSYARAAVELDGGLTEDEVIAAFKDYVGPFAEGSRRGASEAFRLGSKAAARMKEFGVSGAVAGVRRDKAQELFSDDIRS